MFWLQCNIQYNLTRLHSVFRAVSSSTLWWTRVITFYYFPLLSSTSPAVTALGFRAFYFWIAFPVLYLFKQYFMCVCVCLCVCVSICPSKILHILLTVVLPRRGFLLWNTSDCLEKQRCCLTQLEADRVSPGAHVTVGKLRCSSRKTRAQTVKRSLFPAQPLSLPLFGAFLHRRIVFDQEEPPLTWAPGYF